MGHGEAVHRIENCFSTVKSVSYLWNFVIIKTRTLQVEAPAPADETVLRRNRGSVGCISCFLVEETDAGSGKQSVADVAAQTAVVLITPMTVIQYQKVLMMT